MTFLYKNERKMFAKKNVLRVARGASLRAVVFVLDCLAARRICKFTSTNEKLHRPLNSTLPSHSQCMMCVH